MSNPDNTLEPPGTIAILGGGPLAIETALYARYLGFSVIVLVEGTLVPQLDVAPESPPPTLFATPLGLAAIAAQNGLGGTMIDIECETHEAWKKEYFERLCEVDLLRGNVRTHVTIDQITLADAEHDEPADTEEIIDPDDQVPPDFVINWRESDGNASSERFEAIIDMRATFQFEQNSAVTDHWFPSEIRWLGPETTTPQLAPDYYLLLAELPHERMTDEVLADGFGRIQNLFSQLCDRPKLDVYGNLGGFGPR